MHKTGSGCRCSCHGRKYLTKEEKKQKLLHRQECLEKELQGIKEAIADIG